MTTGEFKLEFNTYYNNITSNQAPGVNDYEISQFLTLAQEQIVKEYYEGISAGFEKTESIRKSLNALVKEKKYISTDFSEDDDDIFGIKAYLNPFNVNDNILYIVMEWAKISKESDQSSDNEEADGEEAQESDDSNMDVVEIPSKTVEVIPIKYDDFLRTYKNPFRGITKNRVIRVDMTDNSHSSGSKLYVEKDYDLVEYRIKYLMKPEPIIIGNSDFSGLTINEYPANVSNECKLDSSIHRIILLRAVQLAKAAWQSK